MAFTTKTVWLVAFSTGPNQVTDHKFKRMTEKKKTSILKKKKVFIIITKKKASNGLYMNIINFLTQFLFTNKKKRKNLYRTVYLKTNFCTELMSRG